MDFKLVYTDGEHTQMRHVVEGLVDTVFIPLDSQHVHDKLAFSLVDVNREVLSQRTWDRPLDELLSQAHLAENLMDRMDALEALDYAQFTDELELLICIKPLKHAWRSALSYQGSKQFPKALRYGYMMPYLIGTILFVVKALWALDSISNEYKGDVESMLSDASYVNIALALDALCVRPFPMGRISYWSSYCSR